MTRNKSTSISVDETYAEYETYEQYNEQKRTNKRDDESSIETKEDTSNYEIPYTNTMYDVYQKKSNEKKKVLFWFNLNGNFRVSELVDHRRKN